MNKIKTRLFSIILCLAIAFSIVPVQADTTGQNLVTRSRQLYPYSIRLVMGL